MINHSKSLFLSLFVHLLIFAALLFLYSTVLPKSQEIKETRICVNLQTIKKECPLINKKVVVKKTPPIARLVPEKKVPKKIIKPKKHKVVKKKIKKIVKVKKIEPKVEDKPTVQKQNKVKKVSEIPNKIVKQEVKVAPTKECETISKEKAYINNNLNKISSLIKENLYYPRRARKRGVEGTVVVKFFLHKDATVSNVKILSSKSEILSRAAIRTITELSGKFPKPEEELTLKVPINYTLH